MLAERFADFVFLKIQLYTGFKTNARTNPIIIAIKIGFKIKKDATSKTSSTIEIITFLEYSSSILHQIFTC